jgi:hypothetical protein
MTTRRLLGIYIYVDSQRGIHTCDVGCYGSPATDAGGACAHKSSSGRSPFLDSEYGGVHADDPQGAGNAERGRHPSDRRANSPEGLHPGRLMGALRGTVGLRSGEDRRRCTEAETDRSNLEAALAPYLRL